MMTEAGEDGATDNGAIDHAPWPERAGLLGGLGAVLGFLVYLLVQRSAGSMWTDDPLAMAAAAFLAVGGVVLAFSLEQLRWKWSVGFALATGMIVAMVGWWNGAPADWGAGEGWQFFSSLLAIAVALPLFQAARDCGGFSRNPAVILSHAWTNLILWAAACAFVLAAFLTAVLLGALFSLIGIEVLDQLFRAGWPMAMLIGGAFGGGIGLLRDRDRVLGTLQTVLRSILSVLAPVLAVGLALFVIALPFTGLEPLWEQTKSTTPILLVCLLGALVMVNAVIGNRPVEEARSSILRGSAMALAATMLPLASVAAVSTGKRIGQYGLTPDRLWAVVFVIVACAGALLYLVALVRGRRGWGELLRRANVALALGICGLAFFLALPIVSFGALSARDQVTRLEQGRIQPDRFDWAAMRFDFGPAGRRALERLARAGPAALRAKAVAALQAESRWSLRSPEVATPPLAPPSPPKMTISPAGAAAPPALIAAIESAGLCNSGSCRLALLSPRDAVLLSAGCSSCPTTTNLYWRRPDGSWQSANLAPPRETSIANSVGVPEGRVEIREVSRRQVFVDGKPVGQPTD